MPIRTYRSADDFLRTVQPALEQHEVLNNLPLGLVLSIKKSPERFTTTPYLASVEDDAGLQLAALMTPPHNLLLSNVRDDYQAALPLLVEDLQQNNWPVRGVLGAAPLADACAATWEKLTGQACRPGIFQCLFALTHVSAPRIAPGRLRLARADDSEIIAAWMAAFEAEALPENPRADAREMTERRIRTGTIYVWELDDATLVSMAGISRPIVHTISVGPVYTPAELRGMGYASNCVAAVSQHMLDSGWRSCNLFTDLANLISNSIYQKMGYQPVCEFHEYIFAQ